MNPIERSRDREVAQRLEGVSAGTFGPVVQPSAHDEGKERVRQCGHDRAGLGTILLELGSEEVDDRAYAVLAASIGGNYYDLRQPREKRQGTLHLIAAAQE
jgi:hypothetical protein